MLNDVPKMGVKGQIIEVSDGYARNLLLPKGLAVAVGTKKAIDLLTGLKKQKRIKQELRHQSEIIGKKLSGKKITILRPCNPSGTLYAALQQEDIAGEIFNTLHLHPESDTIILEEPIKKVGEHIVRYRSLNTEVRFEIIVKSQENHNRQ